MPEHRIIEASDTERPVLVAAAQPAEARALLRRHSLRRRSGAPARWRGRVNGHRVDVVVTGTGTTRARTGLEAALAAETPAVVIGIGIAGALSADLGIGDLLVAEKLVAPGDESRTFSVARSPWLELLLAAPKARAGTLVTSERVASTAAAKAELAAGFAGGMPAAVDMESLAWWVAAAGAGVPFVAVRAVSDLVAEDLPLDFNRALRADGSISPARVLAAAVFRPAVWEGLRELRDRVQECSGALEQAVVSMLD